MLRNLISSNHYLIPLQQKDQTLANLLTGNYSFPMISTKELAHVLTLLIHYLFRSVLSILDVESRFFHQTLGKVPNPAAFDTGLSNIWVYNLALTFVVPGSEIVAPTLSRLTAVGTERGSFRCGHSPAAQ